MAVLMAAMTCVECGCWWQHVDFKSLSLGIYKATDLYVEEETIRRLEY
jgi:hypothetical protein